MKLAIVLFLLALPAFAANYGNQVSVILPSGIKTLILHDSVGGTDVPRVFSPGASELVRLTVTPIFVPPSPIGTKITTSITSTGSQAVTPVSMYGIFVGSKINIDLGGSAEEITVTAITATTFTANFANTHTAPFLVDGNTYTDCADPCTVNIPRNSGQQYEWNEQVDSNKLPFFPRKLSANRSAYDRNACGGIGTLPMVEPAVTTTAPLPMPRVVVGQDCFVDRSRVPLISGHASTSLRLWVRIHSAGYNTTGRSDGKVSVQINSGTWIDLTNANSSLHAADEMQYYSRSSAGGFGNLGYVGALLKIGGYAQVRDYLIDIPNGTVGSGDTTVDIAWRFNGTEGNGSGFRILEAFLVEGTDVELTTITFSGLTATATKTAHGFSSGENVVIRGAPGARHVSQGPRLLTGAAANTFTFAACGTGNTSCSTTGVPSAPPANRNTVADARTDQPRMYATRMLVAKSAFVPYTTQKIDAVGPGDAARGEKLFKYCNPDGPGLSLCVNPGLPQSGYKISVACAACHAPATVMATTFTGQAGTDLKYWNYDNHAIQKRSEFHGLTNTDGTDIYAYIRGLNIAVPNQGEPWNPPMQTGPGMSSTTYRRSDSTLTSIADASNTSTVTTAAAHLLKTGDPISVWGGTVDTDLNKSYTITVTGATTFTFPTSGVTDATYTESTLSLTMAHNAFAGCGVDCTLTYGYAEQLETMAPGGSKALWPWNSRIDAWNIGYPWQFPDIAKAWWPTIHPVDSVPSANFLTSSPYLRYQDLIASITPGDFASYQSESFGADLFDLYLNWWTRNGPADEDPPTETSKFQLYPVTAPAWRPPSLFGLFRQSVIQTNLMSQFTLSVEYKLLGLNYQRMVAGAGAATAFGCYPVWGMPNDIIFNIGSHKVQMDMHSIIDGNSATYVYASNIWYIAAPAINGGDCYDTPDNPIDNAYYLAFLQDIALFRPIGYNLFLISQLLTPQLGNQNANLYGSAGGAGMDWTPAMYVNLYGLQGRFSYNWYTSAEWTQQANDLLDRMNELTASRSVAYWEEVINGVPDPQAPTVQSYSCRGAYAAWAAGGTFCDDLMAILTFSTLFGADSGKVTTLLNWAKSITLTEWDAHDWDADIAAATQANTSNGATCSTCGTAGLNTVTFTSCPTTQAGSNSANYPYVISSGGGEAPEIMFPSSGGTCTVGNPGTLNFNTERAHTPASFKATWGCASNSLIPNWNFLVGSETPWWKCSNMLTP